MHVKPVAAGLQSDTDKLMNAFLDSNSVRFEEFSKLWRSLKFSLIYMGRECDRELYEFIDECFRAALTYTAPNNRFQGRIAGLYLLYAFYVKQPMNLTRRVRITLQQWENLISIVEKAQQENHLDVCYIWQQLLLRQAFQFVYYPVRLGPLTTTLGEVIDFEASKRFDEISQPFQTFLEENYLEQLQAVHEQYVQMKEVQPDLSSLNLVNTDIFSDIIKKSNDLRKKLTLQRDISGQGTSAGYESAENTGHSSQEGDDIGSHRAYIRNRQFTSLAPTPQARRHRRVEKAPSISSPGKKPTGRIPLARKRKRDSQRKANAPVGQRGTRALFVTESMEEQRGEEEEQREGGEDEQRGGGGEQSEGEEQQREGGGEKEHRGGGGEEEQRGGGEGEEQRRGGGEEEQRGGGEGEEQGGRVAELSPVLSDQDRNSNCDLVLTCESMANESYSNEPPTKDTDNSTAMHTE